MMPGMPGMGKIDLSAVVLRKTGKDVREGRRSILNNYYNSHFFYFSN